MVRMLFLTVFMLLLPLPQTAGAQEYGRPVLELIQDDRSYINNPHYRNLAEQALTYYKFRPADFPFQKFRKHYSGTSWYDPVADKLREELLESAFVVMNGKDPQTIKNSQKNYERIVSDHLANIGIVMEALALAREDKRFGDPKFFKWMKDGLLQVVIGSGDGKTLSSAYHAYTPDEETMLIAHLKLKLLRTDTQRERRIVYNMHLVQDPKDNREYTIFVDVSRPFTKIEYGKKKEKSATELLRQ